METYPEQQIEERIELADNGETGDERMALALVPAREIGSAHAQLCLIGNGGPTRIDVPGDGAQDSISIAGACRAIGIDYAELRSLAKAALPATAEWDWANSTEPAGNNIDC